MRREIDIKMLRAILLERPEDGHKGTFGQALIIAGQWGMAGASVLAARACFASGVGKVCVDVPMRNNDILQIAVPEAILLHDPSDLRFTHAVETSAYSAVAIGPGIGTNEQTMRALHRQLSLSQMCPLLLDADALNILALHPDWVSEVPTGTILTPHGGEWQRLVSSGADLSRFVVVKKGHHTLIIPPDTTDDEAYVCPWGNCGMATAGSGDVLSGIIVGLMAQGYPPVEAAVMGVSLHALAGDAAAKAMGQHSLTASALIAFLPQALQSICIV